MDMLFTPGRVPDRVLQVEIGGKITHAALAVGDIPEALALLAQTANHTQVIRRAMEDMRQSYQFHIGGARFGLWFTPSGCYACRGEPEGPAAAFTLSAETALQLLLGQVLPAAAARDGRLEYSGPRSDALALQRVFLLFLDQFLIHRIAAEPEAEPIKKFTFGVLGEPPEAASDIYAFRAFDTLEELLESDVDAAFVRQGETFALQCAAAGKHLLCEAPVAQTPEACLRIAETCEAHDATCMAAALRSLPVYTYMRKIVKSGLIGDVLMARAFRGHNCCKTVGGALMALGTDIFAALEFILNSPCAEVTATLGRQAMLLPEAAEDNAAATARFACGTMADITTSCTLQTPPVCSMELHGTRGTILVDFTGEKPLKFYSCDPRMAEDLQRWVEPEIAHSTDWEGLALREACTQFAQCVLDEKQPEWSTDMHAISAVMAGYLSAEEGRPVLVSEIDAMVQEGRSGEILAHLPAAVPDYGQLRKPVYVIEALPREQWQGYELQFSYETAHYLDTELMTCDEGLGVAFTKRAFEEPITKEFTDKLYDPDWDGAQAYGIFDDGALIACVELWRQECSNRLRVTQLLVAEDHRRRGLGKLLMDFAKQQAEELGCRAIILETQSCNEAAIDFYQAQGFSLFGFDRSCYSNQDVENREVRLELGCYLG